ncbi:hypothetical protein E2C01_078009 [Portunus trituberculatus]|uniref:Uncharacterized protein n=1 Tax=Portunus trituberculatus TaxID=210409 RepID=A0A5B7IHM0_PORTR|nr:hypothetical protein [Portunus trituberculatus]
MALWRRSAVKLKTYLFQRGRFHRYIVFNVWSGFKILETGDDESNQSSRGRETCRCYLSLPVCGSGFANSHQDVLARTSDVSKL